MSSAGTDRVILRAPRRSAVLTGVLAAICLAGTAGFLIEGIPLGTVLAGLLSVVWVAFTVRSLRHGIYVSGDRLVNRNALGTRTIAWTEIERFEYHQYGGFGVRTRDGDWIVLQQIPERDVMPAMDVLKHEFELAKKAG